MWLAIWWIAIALANPDFNEIRVPYLVLGAMMVFTVKLCDWGFSKLEIYEVQVVGVLAYIALLGVAWFLPIIMWLGGGSTHTPVA